MFAFAREPGGIAMSLESALAVGTRREVCVLYQIAHGGKGEITSSGVALNNDVLWGKANGPSQIDTEQAAGNGSESSSGMCWGVYTLLQIRDRHPHSA